MPTTVAVPDIGTIEFPDSMDKPSIVRAIKQLQVKRAQPQFQALEKAQEMGRQNDADNAGFTTALGRAAGIGSLSPNSSLAQIAGVVSGAPFSIASTALKEAVPEEFKQKLMAKPGIVGTIPAAYDFAADILPMLAPMNAGSKALNASRVGKYFWKVIGGAFGLKAAQDLPESARKAGQAWGNPKLTLGQKLAATEPALAEMGIGALGLSHAALPERPVAPPTLGETLAKKYQNILPQTAKAVVDQEVKKGENASQESKTKILPQLEVRPPVGETPPLRQPGKAPEVQEPRQENPSQTPITKGQNETQETSAKTVPEKEIRPAEPGAVAAIPGVRPQDVQNAGEAKVNAPAPAPAKIYYASGSTGAFRGGVQYVSESPEVAAQYEEGGKFGRKGAKLKSFSASLNTFDSAAASPQERAAILGQENLKGIEPDGYLNFDWYENDPSINERLKKAGYDSIKISEGENGVSIAVLDKSKLHPTSPPAEPAQVQAGGKNEPVAPPANAPTEPTPEPTGSAAQPAAEKSGETQLHEFTDEEDAAHQNVIRNLVPADESKVKQTAAWASKNTKWPKDFIMFRGKEGTPSEGLEAALTPIAKKGRPFQVTFFARDPRGNLIPVGDVPVSSLEEGIRNAYQRNFEHPESETSSVQAEPGTVGEPASTSSSTPGQVSAGVEAPVAPPQRLKLKNSPQIFVLLERLPQTETERELGEQPVRVKNERTGREEVMLESDFTPVKSSGKKSAPVASDDLDNQLRSLGMEPSVFKSKAEKQSAIKRAQAKAAQAQAPKGPGIIGMGGATPEEFEHPGDYVSNMFAIIDKARAQEGKPPMEKKAGRSWDTDNQIALAKMNRDPDWIPNLLKEVAAKPRPLLSWENAGVVWQRQKIKAEAHNAMVDLNRAFEDGRQADVDSKKLEVARWEDELDRLDRIVGKGGTGSEAGRSLQAQKMGAGDDFSLVEMRAEMRASKGGEKLTESEEKEIAELHRKLTEAQSKMDAADAAARAREADLQAKLEIERLKKMPPPSASIPPHVKIIADRLKTYFDNRADAARNRLRGKVFSVGPEMLLDLADLGASKILSGLSDQIAWGADMVRELGESIKPHLQEIWDAANKAIDTQLAQTPLDQAQRAQVRIRAMPPEQRVNYYKNKVADKMKAGKKDEITASVQLIARALVEQNPKIERDALVDGVRHILDSVLPGITREDTRDMISGYGDYRQISKDEISRRLRDLKGQMQQVAKLEAMQRGKPPLKTGSERRVPSAEERRLIRLVNDAKREFQVPVDDPETQLKSSLDTLKTRLENKMAEYKEKIANGDFTTKPRRPIQLDAEAQRLKRQYNAAKQDFERMRRNAELQNRAAWEKGLDTAARWSRGILLSGPSTVWKLASAAAWRTVLNPVEEMAGSVWRHVPGVRRIAERAPIEGAGFNMKRETHVISSMFMRALDDIGTAAKTGKTPLDILYGGKYDIGYAEDPEAVKSVANFFGYLHAAIKAPVKRAAFTRAFEAQCETLGAQGVDVSDPMVQVEMAVRAYKRANMDVFTQPNRFSDSVKQFISNLERKDKITGRTPISGKLGATGLRLTIPIVRVPTNIVAETLTYAFGIPKGAVKSIAAFRRGIETLTPEEADMIMRDLKKGSIGSAALLLGFFAPNMFGGFYQQGQKKKSGQPDYEAAMIQGYSVPRTVVHAPLIEAAQFAATVRKVADSKLRKKDTETQGLTSGMEAGLLGLADETPAIGNILEMSKLFDPHQRQQFIAQLAESRLVPQLISQPAKIMDENANGQPIRRDARGFTQGIESGIPGLRQRLPVKK